MHDAPTPVVEPPTGELVLGRYRLVRRLGAGGMGVVWLGYDERLGREVAVKRIAAEAAADGRPGGRRGRSSLPDGRAARRAEKEALAAARLGHPGIVALYEAGREESGYVLVSELVRGSTLAQLLRAGRLSDLDVVQIGAQLCDALAHAHARGVVHRDVKPSNVICPDEPEGGAVAKLTDFGIAHLVGDGDPLTRTGDVVGTLAYMAPEQARGERVTAAADVYALGIVLYEALAGANPVRGAGAADTVANLGRRVPPLRRARRDLPPALCAAVDAAVAVAPEERLSPAELRGALLDALDEVGDVPGPVAPSALESVTRVWSEGRERARTAGPWWRRRRARGDEGAGAEEWAGGTAVGPPEGARGADHRFGPGAEDAFGRGGGDPYGRAAEDRFGARAEDRPLGPVAHGAVAPGFAARRRRRLLARVAGAAGVGALAAAAVAELPAAVPPRAAWAALPVEPLALGLGVASVALVLPRLAWLVAALAVTLWAAGAAPGVALVLLAAAAPVPLLLRRAGATWSLPAAGPLLGLAGLALAFCALAGQAARARDRFALGALGAWWLLLGERLLDAELLLGRVPGARSLPSWDASAVDAVQEAVQPLLASGAIGLALVWGIAAATLPALVRGRTAAVDALAAAAWAIGLAVATGALGEAVGAGSPRGLAAGALLAAVLAVAARALAGPRAAEDPAAA